MIWKEFKHKAPEFDVDYSINDIGFRGRRHQISAGAGTKRVAVVGASYVFGLGVEDDQVFTSLIERGLGRAEVLNLGVMGSGIATHAYLYRIVARRFDPDVVLLHIHLNGRDDIRNADFSPIIGQADPALERTRRLLRALPGYYWLGERSHLLARQRKTGPRGSAAPAGLANVAIAVATPPPTGPAAPLQ